MLDYKGDNCIHSHIHRVLPCRTKLGNPALLNPPAEWNFLVVELRNSQVEDSRLLVAAAYRLNLDN